LVAKTTLTDYLATFAYLGGQADDVLAVITGDQVHLYQRPPSLRLTGNDNWTPALNYEYRP
jgi:hypothetical protein